MHTFSVIPALLFWLRVLLTRKKKNISRAMKVHAYSKNKQAILLLFHSLFDEIPVLYLWSVNTTLRVFQRPALNQLSLCQPPVSSPYTGISWYLRTSIRHGWNYDATTASLQVRRRCCISRGADMSWARISAAFSTHDSASRPEFCKAMNRLKLQNLTAFNIDITFSWDMT